MQITRPVITIGWILALIVLILALLGFLGVVPFSSLIVFSLIGILAVARLL